MSAKSGASSFTRGGGAGSYDGSSPKGVPSLPDEGAGDPPLLTSKGGSSSSFLLFSSCCSLSNFCGIKFKREKLSFIVH